MKSYPEWLEIEDGRLRVVFNGIDLESIMKNENEQEVEDFLSSEINGKKVVGEFSDLLRKEIGTMDRIGEAHH